MTHSLLVIIKAIFANVDLKAFALFETLFFEAFAQSFILIGFLKQRGE